MGFNDKQYNDTRIEINKVIQNNNAAQLDKLEKLIKELQAKLHEASFEQWLIKNCKIIYFPTPMPGIPYPIEHDLKAGKDLEELLKAYWKSLVK